MQKRAQRAIERPAYLLESVDNALKLLQMLRDVGALRLKEAAEELHIAPSTAHRLLAMLVYRGFAVNVEQTEEGIAAFGVAIHNRGHQAIGAITVAVPANRFQRHTQGPLVAQIRKTVREIEVDVDDIEA